jgi:hypothetical protein
VQDVNRSPCCASPKVQVVWLLLLLHSYWCISARHQITCTHTSGAYLRLWHVIPKHHPYCRSENRPRQLQQSQPAGQPVCCRDQAPLGSPTPLTSNKTTPRPPPHRPANPHHLLTLLLSPGSLSHVHPNCTIMLHLEHHQPTPSSHQGTQPSPSQCPPDQGPLMRGHQQVQQERLAQQRVPGTPNRQYVPPADTGVTSGMSRGWVREVLGWWSVSSTSWMGSNMRSRRSH